MEVKEMEKYEAINQRRIALRGSCGLDELSKMEFFAVMALNGILSDGTNTEEAARLAVRAARQLIIELEK